MVRGVALGAALVVAALIATPAHALPITFAGSSGSRSASATFEQSGSQLLVKLTNTSAFDVLAPSNVLTGVFFTLWGVSSLTPISAALDGSDVLFGPDGGGDVGGEWAYRSALWIHGISSTGADGIFGPGDLFGGANLQGPTSPDGLQYGITSAGDDPSTGNAPVTGGHALIQNSVLFTLGGLPSGFQLHNWSVLNVAFNYGTSLNLVPGFRQPPEQPPVSAPEPATLVLLGSGLVAFTGAAAWKRRRRT